MDITLFADNGAWHGYALPSEDDTDRLGSFTGPLYIAQEYAWFLSEGFTQLSLVDKQTEKEVPLADAEADIESYPGLLEQEFTLEGLTVRLRLRFVTDRSALVTARIENTGDTPRQLMAKWSGSLLPNQFDAPSLTTGQNGVRVTFDRVRETWSYMTSGEERFEVTHDAPVTTTISEDSYTTTRQPPITLSPGDTEQLAWTESYTLTSEEAGPEADKTKQIRSHPDEYIGSVEQRWDRYLDSVSNNTVDTYEEVGIKAVETLIGNWRSPAGAVESDGMTPSISYKWFAGGFWAWDTWKQAVGTARFDPGLAEQLMWSMFDHQVTEESETRPQDAGMIQDLIAYNTPDNGGGNWNERNSKPPLAAWAAWEIYQQNKNVDFLEALYPKLVEYHNWWYRTRDHDGNGIAEYGATVHPSNDSEEAIVTAAAWESGMDNAPRFDDASVLENRDNGNLVGYSLDQESVDLNSYLYAEKQYLAEIADTIGQSARADMYRRAADDVRGYIQTHMFHEDTGFFYDITTDKTPLIEARGVGRAIEGAIPLWAGVATEEQAEAVVDVLTDESEFNTYLPFPTVARSAPEFHPQSYWRGNVWLDQAKFAIEGLERYGYSQVATELTKKLFHHGEGILGDRPIHENYNPLTGERLNSPNFSWSAASLLTLSQDFL
ncbi:MGH1-like glycoside hydrolase domain-containing protein [Haloarcula halophila]|uniref:MGH1-like glycoside hydrolase domain-containing protein n=1 Tax=Haloarcula TaxID=2237 RepID=UPI0023E3D3D7|nr:trehalase family glycosidase [Halomicroarcula sp. DFY41]